jgi:hypothetical protein
MYVSMYVVPERDLQYVLCVCMYACMYVCVCMC